MNNKFLIFLYILPLFLVAGCEDDITDDLNLEASEPLVVIDAWINNKSESQTIQLLGTQPYFDNSGIIGLDGATVSITDDNGIVYPFVGTGDGTYTWTPNAGESFGEIGGNYNLSVIIDGVNYSAFSSMNRVPAIDSITSRIEEETAFSEEGIFAEFWSRDPIGPNDTYWIKTWKNGEYLREPGQINIAYDAGFSAGGLIDGLIFIPPIRDAINPQIIEDGTLLSPYTVGDMVYVELHSIPNEAFYFLEEVRRQTDRPGGFAELFSVPLSNVPTNIQTTDTSTNVLGFFTVSAVSSLSEVIE